MMPRTYKPPYLGSKARNLQRSRNLQNLHFLTGPRRCLAMSSSHDDESEPIVQIVPTVSKKEIKKNYFIPNSTPPQHNLPPSLISPPIIPNLPKQKKTFQQPDSYQNSMNAYRRRSRKQRKRSSQRSARFRAARDLQYGNNYHWFYPNVYPPENKNETAELATDAPEESYFEEVEVASDDNESRPEIPVGFRKSKIHYLKYKKQLFFKPKIYRIGQQRTIVNCSNPKNETAISPDVVDVSETEYEVDIENEKSDQVDSQDNLEEVEDDDDCQIIFVKTNVSIPEEKSDSKSESRIYQTCIEDSHDLLQGKSLIQNSLDTWKAHLIGLQYLIEIQNASKDSAVKYHCVLCSEDISVGGFPSISVINHINGYKHVVKYLEKHFPACGYSYDENGSFDNNVVIIQKLCEEINRIEGYYFMCITSIDQFEKGKEKILDLIINATQSTEDSDKIDINLLQRTFETLVMNEISDVLNNILDKIAPIEDPAKKSGVETCNKPWSAKDKVKGPAFRPKRSSAVSSYLKLKMAFNRPQNVKSSVVASKEISQENISLANTGAVSDTKSKTLEKNYADNKALPEEVKNVVIQVVSKPPLKAVSKAPSNMVIKKPSKVFSKAPSKIVHKGPSKIVYKAPSKVVSKVLSKAINKARSKIISKVPMKAVPRVVKSISSPKVDLQRKGKAVLTPNVHSKHCLKRILGKENSSLIEGHAAGVSLKPSVKHQSGGDRINSSSASKSVMPEKKKIIKNVELKRCKTSSSSHKLKSPLRKVTSVQKVSGVSSVSPIKSRSKSPYRIVNYKDTKIFSHEVRAVIRNTHKKIVTQTESPRRRSRSPFKRTVRRQSKSPLRPVIKSPIRVSPLRKRSRTPVRRRQRTPIRRDSRSPVRRRSRSPVKTFSRSPVRRHSRSPVKTFSRSPVRRRSRSPVKRYLRSPDRRRSRSPLRRQSRSPVKRHSRSPFRRVSRSPIRRHSRSPYRKYSRSPLRRYSRSPHRRHSRSPLRRSRSPHKRHSRSPLRYSKSPLRRHSRSPRRDSRSPRRDSRSPISLFKSSYRGLSPSFEHRIIHDRKNSPGLFSGSKMPFDMHLNMQKLLEYKEKHASKHLSPNRSNSSKKFMHSHSFASDSGRDIDLDPVSDEDESVYFNTLDQQQHTERQMSPSKMVLAQFFKKFSTSDESPNDITLNKFMQFMQAHSEEIKDLMGSHIDPKSSNMPSANVDTNAQERNLLLKQYLLSNLAGNIQGTVIPNLPYAPPVPNVPPSFIQPPFIPNQPPPSFGHVHHMPTQNIPSSSHNPEKIFPPNLNMPPPERFPQFNQPHQGFPPKPQVPPEVMFKDLKATVSKLFGANESMGKQDKNKNVPVFVNEPDPKMWELNHPDSQKFNSPPGQKNMFFSPGKKSNFHGIPGITVREEIPPSYDGGPCQFYNNRGNIEQTRPPNVSIPPPDAKVSFCDIPAGSSKGNLFPVVNSARMSSNRNSTNTQASHDVKVSLASRLASVLVKVGMIDVPAPLLQEMLMKIGAFSSSPPQDITEAEIVSILKRLGYLS